MIRDDGQHLAGGKVATRPAMRLLFHIGAGKTGTSSIQHTLRANKAALEKQGFWYMGLMMEHAPVQHYPWQKTSASELFHSLNANDTTEQLLAVLRPTFEAARAAGAHTLIWSNESFFGRDEKVRAALQGIQADGVDVQILAYVRRHDSWARSAYIQWGIKHKTYKGPLKTFKQWIEQRPPKFAEPLASLGAVFPGRLTIRNLDAVKDAVADFLEVCEIDPVEISQTRTNETPSGAEIFLRAVFNSRFEEKVLPNRFSRAIGNDVNFLSSPAAYLEGLLPSPEDVEKIRHESQKDRDALNAMLVAQGQLPIEESPLKSKALEVDLEHLVKALCEIVLRQSLRIEKLERAAKDSGDATGDN